MRDDEDNNNNIDPQKEPKATMTTPWDRLTDDTYKSWLLEAMTVEEYNASTVRDRRGLLSDFEQQQQSKEQRKTPPTVPPSGYRTPAKRALRELGIDEKASPNEAVGQIAIHFQNLSLRYRYTTQDEGTIGKRIQSDNDDDGIAFDITSFARHQPITIDSNLFEPDPNSTSTGEDLQINEPFSRIISTVASASLKIMFTGKHSNLIDDEGREQRVDLSVFNSDFEEWASLVTVVEGKQDLLTANYNSALGQCMRRANAILTAQPWRSFVIIPFHCLRDIAFLKVEWEGTRDFGRPKPVRSTLYKCLTLDEDDEDKVVVGEGFRALCAMLENPALLGYLPCPVIIKTELPTVGLRSAHPLCIRGKQKALFVVEMVENDAACVLKVFRERDASERERANVQKLHAIPGTISLKQESLLTIQCDWDGQHGDFVALLLSPYCRALTPSLASKSLFGQYAQVLLDAWNAGLCNNDISPDNLLVIKKTEGTNGIVTDWEIATPPGTRISKHTGKLLFCPATADGEDRTSSLLGDLESLFYVAISCAENGVRWSIKRNDRSSRDMFLRRSCHTGLGGRKSGSFEKWDTYLVNIRKAILCAKNSIADDDVEKVVYAFNAA